MESLDEVFSLFTRERRRYALYYLDQVDDAVPVEELAEQIHLWEDDPDRDEGADDADGAIVLELEHNHLPQIEEADHVEYDRTNEEVRISGLSAEADVILSVTRAIERPSDSEDYVMSRLG